MTMARLTSLRVADKARSLSLPLSKLFSRRLGPGIAAARALDEWEAEGGSADPARSSARSASQPPPIDRHMLERLGAALVGEWNNLPPPLQRAVFERAAGGSSSSSLATRKQLARFLHDRKTPGTA